MFLLDDLVRCVGGGITTISCPHCLETLDIRQIAPDIMLADIDHFYVNQRDLEFSER